MLSVNFYPLQVGGGGNGARDFLRCLSVMARKRYAVGYARGCRDWRKIHNVDFGCKLGWEINFRSF